MGTLANEESVLPHAIRVESFQYAILGNRCHQQMHSLFLNCPIYRNHITPDLILKFHVSPSAGKTTVIPFLICDSNNEQ